MIDRASSSRDDPTEPHRADYILERGTWRVTCRVCGWHADGPVRRQLASLFRFHLRTRVVAPASEIHQ